MHMVHAKLALIVALLAVGLAGPGHALEVGDLAPNFELVGSDGATHSLAALRGRGVVVAWFPKAFTPG